MSGKLAFDAKKARRRNACGLFNTHGNSQIHMDTGYRLFACNMCFASKATLPCSATMADQAGLKLGARWRCVKGGSVTMADQAGLKPVGADTPFEQGHLFQRTAKSARSSCFCDPPGRFSIRLSDLRKRLFPP